MRSVFDEIVLLCPDLPTGGPEAMHQLGFVINQLGGNAKIAYYGAKCQVEIYGEIIRSTATASPMPAHFDQYQPKLLHETKAGPRTLIVYPEIMLSAATANPDAPYRRAVWWLSVDNAVTYAAQLADEAWKRAFFTDTKIFHLYQSAYARDFLRREGAQNCFPLSDYTDPQSLERSLGVADNPPITERTNKICFFPLKGAALARQFIATGALRNQIDIVPIIQMSKEQVRDTLFSSRIYIDFGHHPGKDRVPREAAIAGNVVLLHAQGSALYPEDHPLPDIYRFTATDIASGKLHRLVDEILDDPAAHFAAQADYRRAVINEREHFESEIRNFFFAGG